MSQYKRLWITLCVVVAASFSVLGFFGHRAISDAPPIPREVVTTEGRLLFDGETIRDGQNVWQSIGGQQVGSVFGHGAYVAPDWTADWLHREAVHTLGAWARAEGAAGFDSLAPERQDALRARLRREMRANTYDPATDRLTVSAVRAEAVERLTPHYADVFASGRSEYAIPAGALADAAKARQMGAFFFWTSWVASTERPGQIVSYTQNWPHEPLVGNTVTGGSIIWSIVSVILLLAGTGALVWHFASQKKELGYFVLGLVTGTSYTKRQTVKTAEPDFTLPRGEIHATAAD